LGHPDGVFDVEAEKEKAFESEANAFAGEFLVPLDSLKSAFRQCRDCNVTDPLQNDRSIRLNLTAESGLK
jgi:Zn-dependent peptidase ImmA (M78 family)